VVMVTEGLAGVEVVGGSTGSPGGPVVGYRPQDGTLCRNERYAAGQFSSDQS